MYSDSATRPRLYTTSNHCNLKGSLCLITFGPIHMNRKYATVKLHTYTGEFCTRNQFRVCGSEMNMDGYINTSHVIVKLELDP